MKVTCRVVEDEDVLDTFLGEGASPRPLEDFGYRYGKLLYTGSMATVPTDEDVIVVDGVEYMVVFRVFRVQDDEVELVLHPREYESEDLMS